MREEENETKKLLKRIYENIRSIPKTILFNFKYLKFNQAIRLPFKISYKVILKSVKGKIELNIKKLNRGIIRIGFGDVAIFDNKKSKSIWNVNGCVIFNGECNIGHGSKIDVGSNARLVIGDKFTITSESTIICKKEVIIGDNCLISWDVLIMDTDFHKIFDRKGTMLNPDKSVIIGNRVWIGCRSVLLKGALIGDECIIAANSVVTKACPGKNKIYGSNPIIELKGEVSWGL